MAGRKLPRGYCDGCNRVADAYYRRAWKMGRLKERPSGTATAVVVPLLDEDLMRLSSDVLAPIAYEASGAPYNRGRKVRLCPRCLRRRMGWKHWRRLPSEEARDAGEAAPVGGEREQGPGEVQA